jgi:hypothetical protein
MSVGSLQPGKHPRINRRHRSPPTEGRGKALWDRGPMANHDDLRVPHQLVRGFDRGRVLLGRAISAGR